jgi:hypothetical protein
VDIYGIAWENMGSQILDRLMAFLFTTDFKLSGIVD